VAAAGLPQTFGRKHGDEHLMENSNQSLLYDSIGNGYRRFRVPDPRIARQIREAIGNASTVCNIGAGTGSYEPSDLKVTAVEPSERMIEQRADSNSVIRAFAEDLPFENGQFDVAMAVLTVHHWADPVKGLSEMRRVSHRQVIMTFDPMILNSYWLVRDYLPEFAAPNQTDAIPINTYLQILHPCEISPVMIPWDCLDGFLASYWRRPQMYLDPGVRSAISSFARQPESVVSRAISKLEHNIASGEWNKRYSELLERQEMDLGYRLLVADTAA
jgi:SAM-dependent methyltransferase